MRPREPALHASPVGDDDVHVWKIDLDDAGWDAFADTLSADEHVRAARFRGAALQENFRRCRGALRRVLAAYSRQRPEDIRFRYGEFGKPELDGSALQFNLSHSRGFAIVGVSAHPIGIDIEYRKDLAEIDGLIEMTCGAAEKAEAERLPSAGRHEWFYRTWVRKEAFCKAVGAGLQADLKNISIDAQGRVTHGGISGDEAFHVRDLQIDAACSASLCTVLPAPRIRIFPAEPELCRISQEPEGFFQREPLS